jgi:O-antigen/teichoic acid export membrane protein
VGTQRRSAGTLAAGSLLAGLLAYVFFSLTTRALGAEAAAPVAVLWTYWGLSGAAITFPIQHWISREIELRGSEQPVRSVLPKLVKWVVVAAVAATGFSFLLGERLLRTSEPSFPLLMGLVTVGAAALGLVRGVLSGRRQFGRVSASLLLENGIRVGVAIGLVLGSADHPASYGWALVSGYLAVLAYPSTLRLASELAEVSRSRLKLMGEAGVSQLAAQFALTGAPLLVALLGGSNGSITAFFATLALLRAPYTIAVAAVGPLTTHTTQLLVAGDRGRLKRLVLQTGFGTVGFAVLAWPVANLIGPDIVALIFGADVQLSGPVTGVLATASVFAIGNLVIGVVLMAKGHARIAVVGWLVGAGVALASLVVVPGSVAKSAAAFVIVEVVAFAWSFLALYPLRRRST